VAYGKLTPDKAREIVQGILKILDDSQHDYRIKCFEYMFRIYFRENNKAGMEQTLLDAVRYLEKLDYKKQLADFYIMLGRFYSEIMERELAISYINKGLDIYKELGIILNN
jgi:tetratricopeptide (TPR) repeat protein